MAASHLNLGSGSRALQLNTTGSENVAAGSNALGRNTVGRRNLAAGFKALSFNRGGDENTALGHQALSADRTGNANLALGSGAGRNLTGSDNLAIANPGVAGESGAIRIGTDGLQRRAFLAGVFGASVPNGVPVLVGANGRLGTATSRGARAGANLARELRRQRAQNRRQARQIATLKREVRRLSRR
jgi:hypothetical protein